jgi:hypothetical protein
LLVCACLNNPGDLEIDVHLFFESSLLSVVPLARRYCQTFQQEKQLRCAPVLCLAPLPMPFVSPASLPTELALSQFLLQIAFQAEVISSLSVLMNVWNPSSVRPVSRA